MFFFFFYKQKTAYDMRISDWSSDVCSSDLQPLQLCVLALKILQWPGLGHFQPAILRLPVVDRCFGNPVSPGQVSGVRAGLRLLQHPDDLFLIGRASCWDRMCQYDYISAVGVYL